MGSKPLKLRLPSSSFLFFIAAFYAVFLILASGENARSAFGDCAPGYRFDPRSGVGCVQENCASVPSAHYSYEGYCVCGSSGSIAENPKDPNLECAYPADHAGCPGCVFACVHLDEKCPAAPGTPANAGGATAPANSSDGTAADARGTATQADGAVQDAGSAPADQVNRQDQEEATTSLSALAASGQGALPTCEQYCEKLFGGREGVTLVEKSGNFPVCRCQADYKNKLGVLERTVTIDGDSKTALTFDPSTGELKSRDTVSLEAERQAIRERLGFKYKEEEIDRLLVPENVDKWFDQRMENIDTSASWLSPNFWFQHIVALLDHGFGNSADFVDTYHYGRCGDSMLWLERELSRELDFTADSGKKSEAMLSITGEKYWNLINHTSLIIRPQGINNEDWSEIVTKLTEGSRKDDGLDEGAIKHIDPRLLDAKVLDPYYQRATTVRDFIKGWSVIRIS